MVKRQLPYGFLQRLVNLLEDRGVTQEQLYSTHEVLTLTSGGVKRLDAAGIPLLLKAAVSLTNDPSLVLRLGRQVDLASYGTFGFALMSCTDLEHVLSLLRRYYQLTGPAPTMEVLDWDGGKALRVKVELGDPNLERLLTESTFSQICHLGEALINHVIDEGELHFNYPAPNHREAYEAIFSMPVKFGETHSQILIPERLLSARVTTANPAGHVIFQQQCDEMLRRINRVENFSATVRRVLIHAGSTFPDIAEVAKRLHISGRTLRRRLEDESTSFRAICDEVKNVLACEYLNTTSLTVAEIADLLGYSEPVSFRRAFIRWNELTPSQYRRRSSTLHR